MSNMVQGELLQELTQRLTAERERRQRMVERFQADLEESVAAEVWIQTRIDLLPKGRLTASSPDVVKDFRGAPAIIVELLDAAGAEGMIGAELTARLRQKGIERNTIEQAKQRLKRDKKILDFDGRVWRLKQHMPERSSPMEAIPADRASQKRARAQA